MVLRKEKIFIRFSIISFWVVLIVSALYLSSFELTKTDKKSINVLIWPGMYDLEYISKFEKETGIKVKFSYFESNEELLVKIRATKGRGYDLITPGDYAVNILKKEGLLKKLDRSKMPFFDNLNPMLLNHYFDPENKYSVPAEWAVFGFGINKEYFENKDVDFSWRMVFDPKFIPGKIVVLDDSILVCSLAAIYLYGGTESLNIEKLNKIRKILKKQRPFIEAYTDSRPDYYISTRNNELAVSSSAYIWRGMFVYKHVDFVVPKEGSMVTIENFVIPKASKKEDLAYQFLNFLMKVESVKHNFESEASLFPVTLDVLPTLTLRETAKKLLFMNRQDFEKFKFFRLDKFQDSISEEFFYDLWLDVKSSVYVL